MKIAVETTLSPDKTIFVESEKKKQKKMQALKLETELNKMNITENNITMPYYLRSNAVAW